MKDGRTDEAEEGERAEPSGSARTRQRDQLVLIRALLAKAEATDFPEEAELFTAKATELIAKFSIDEALLWSASDSAADEPDEIKLVLLAPYLGPKSILVNLVARAFGCMAIRLQRSSNDRQTMSICGFRNDLSVVEALITSLLVQMSSAMHAEERELARTTPGTSRMSATQRAAWRRSFIIGFAEIAANRLTESRSSQASAADDGARAESSRDSGDGDTSPGRSNRGDGTTAPPRSVALALKSRDKAVRSEFRRRYPYVRSGRTSTGGSAQGRTAGRQAGSNADIGHSRLGARRALPR